MKHPATGQEIINKDFYVYQSSVASIANGANATDTINIQADSDFILQKLTFVADVAAAAQTDSSRVLPLITVQLTDTGSGRQIFSDPVPIPAIFGRGELPFILPNPRLFRANTTIAISYSNYDAALTYQIFLQFVGMKIYRA